MIENKSVKNLPESLFLTGTGKFNVRNKIWRVNITCVGDVAKKINRLLKNITVKPDITK